MIEAPDDEPEDTVAIAARAAAGIGAILALGALALYGSRAGLSVVAGAAIAVANILTMRVVIRKLLPPPAPDEPAPDADTSEPGDEAPSRTGDGERAPQGRRSSIGWGLLAATKMLLLFGGLWFLLTHRVVDPMPLLVGYGAMPLGIVASALWPNLGRRRP